jgi:predicted RNase H-like HicB family nuclease
MRATASFVTPTNSSKKARVLIIALLDGVRRVLLLQIELSWRAAYDMITSMDYRIRLIQSEEGWAVSCPALPGCHSRGATREEAVENIKIAIREWLQVEAEESGVRRVEEETVAV